MTRASRPDASARRTEIAGRHVSPLSSNYATIAQELGLRRIPVATLLPITSANPHDPQWGFHPSAKPSIQERSPANSRPDATRSIWVGTGRRHRWPDEAHHGRAIDANVAGEYLGACVWYEVLFGKSAVGNKFVTRGTRNGIYAKFLQTTAHRAVTELH